MSRRWPAGLLAAIAICAALAACQGSGPLSPVPANGTAAPGAMASRATGGRGTPGGGAAPELPFDVSGLLDPAGRYIGVYANGAPRSLLPVRRFAASIGRKPNLIGEYVAWRKPFDAAGVSRAWSYGALAYLAWEPYGTTAAAIAAGGSDAYIRQFAHAVRKLDLPVVLSFGHEMNGNWYPWGSSQTSPADFVAAWRHIHALFQQAGASNVIWMWNPNIVNIIPGVRLRPLYPGNAYVDWVGITGYFPTTGPHTYSGLYGPTVRQLRQFTRKPVIIAETSVESGPAEVASAAQLVTTATRHGVVGFIWFDYHKNGIDWRIESRPILRAALAHDLAPVRLASLTRY